MAIVPLPLKADFRVIAGKPAKDRTGASRSRRYRRRKASRTMPETVTASVTVSTTDICTLAARVGAGRATAEEMQLAERLLLALAAMLPENGAIGLPE